MKLLPMLAKPLPQGFDPGKFPGRYVAEEKFDGHRMIVQVDGSLVTAWSRTGKDCGQKLSMKMRTALSVLPNCILDGELVMVGGHSYDVARLENHNALEFVVFDILELDGVSLVYKPYSERRDELCALEISGDQLGTAGSHTLRTREDLDNFVELVWKDSGEGLIIKDTRAHYYPGKRSDAFYKLKQCGRVVATIVGFEASSGEIVNRGSCAVTIAVDDEGNEIKVKTLDDATCRKLEQDPDSYIGRRLMIEYHERTADGNYRHPRWDRFEDE